MVDETTSEMKGLMDKCMSDFSVKMQDMLTNFQHKLDSVTMSTPVRPIKKIYDCGVVISNETNHNNSHSVTNDNSKGMVEINCKRKPQLYDGSDDLDEYLTDFNLLAELNGRNPRSKVLFLASSLSGGARAILNEITQRARDTILIV